MASIELHVTDASGRQTGTVQVPQEFFGQSAEDVSAHVPLVHQVVVAQLAAARQGTHAVRTRGMVSGGGKKPWKQKGTGRARQGSIRSPQWAGGGVAQGPVPHGYAQRTPKKMKAAALRYVLSDRANAGRVHVLDLGIADSPSTKTADAALAHATERRYTTVVVSRANVNEWLSTRNIPTVHVLFADQLNTYDVVTAEDVVFTQDGLDAFLESRATHVTASGDRQTVQSATAASPAADSTAVESTEA